MILIKDNANHTSNRHYNLNIIMTIFFVYSNLSAKLLQRHFAPMQAAGLWGEPGLTCIIKKKRSLWSDSQIADTPETLK